MKSILSILLILSALVGFTGCTSVTSTSPTGVTTTTKQVNWADVDLGVQLAAQASTVLVLQKNPSYATIVSSVNTTLAGILVTASGNTPSIAGYTAALLALAVVGLLVTVLSADDGESLSAGTFVPLIIVVAILTLKPLF